MPTDYGNSHKNKREKAVSETNEAPGPKVVMQVVTEPVIIKKPGIGHRFKTVFFGGDFRGAAGYVAADVLLPALRNLVVDMMTKGAERAVYGDSRPSRRPTGSFGYTSRISYNSPISRPSLRPAQLPDQNNVVRVVRSQPNEMIIHSRDEAEMVLERLVDIIDQYGVTSVADLYDLTGNPVSPIDQKWGWTNLNSAEVRQVKEGYLLSLPSVEEI